MPPVGLNNVSITGNIVFNCYEGIYIQPGLQPGSGPYAINNLRVSGNLFAGMTSQSTGGTYPGVYVTNSPASAFAGAGRSVDSYSAAIGVGGSDTAFFAAVDQESEQTWNAALTPAVIDAWLKV